MTTTEPTAHEPKNCERKRAYAMADAGIREIAPMGLDAVKWTDLADRLRAIAPVVDMASAQAALAICREVRTEAQKRPHAAAYAAYAAAYAAYAAASAAAAYAYAYAKLSLEERARIRSSARRPIIEATLRAFERAIAIAA
jgi:hypothetical protein